MPTLEHFTETGRAVIVGERVVEEVPYDDGSGTQTRVTWTNATVVATGLQIDLNFVPRETSDDPQMGDNPANNNHATPTQEGDRS